MKGPPMIRDCYCFTFSNEIEPSDIDDLLHLAIFSASSLHGESAALLDVRYTLDSGGRVCSIDVSSGIGHEVAKIFTGYIAEEFDDGTFRIQRMVGEGVPA